MYIYSQAKGQRRSAKERKEHHSIPANSFSHSNSNSSTQSIPSAAVKMSQNFSNTSQLTRGADGRPTPDPSTYPRELEFNNTQSDFSGSQLAQTTSSNASHGQGSSNQGDHSASHGNVANYDTVHRTWGQTQQQGPFNNVGAVPSGPPGGFQNQGSAAGTGQGGAQGGGYGGGNAAAGTGGYDNGYVDSMSAARSQSGPGR